MDTNGTPTYIPSDRKTLNFCCVHLSNQGFEDSRNDALKLGIWYSLFAAVRPSYYYNHRCEILLHIKSTSHWGSVAGSEVLY